MPVPEEHKNRILRDNALSILNNMEGVK